MKSLQEVYGNLQNIKIKEVSKVTLIYLSARLPGRQMWLSDEQVWIPSPPFPSNRRIL